MAGSSVAAGGSARRSRRRMLAAFGTACLLVAVFLGVAVLVHAGDVRAAAALRASLAVADAELVTLEKLVGEASAVERRQLTASEHADRARTTASVVTLRKAAETRWARITALSLPADLRVALSKIQELHTAYLRSLGDQLPVPDSARAEPGEHVGEVGRAGAVAVGFRPVRDMIAAHDRVARTEHGTAIRRTGVVGVGAGLALLAGVAAFSVFAASPRAGARPVARPASVAARPERDGTRQE